MGHLRLAAFSIKSEWKRKGFGLPPHTSQLVASGKWNSKLASHQLAVESNLHPGIVSKGLLKCSVWIPLSLYTVLTHSVPTRSVLTHSVLTHSVLVQS